MNTEIILKFKELADKIPGMKSDLNDDAWLDGGEMEKVFQPYRMKRKNCESM